MVRGHVAALRPPGILIVKMSIIAVPGCRAYVGKVRTSEKEFLLSLGADVQRLRSAPVLKSMIHPNGDLSFSV